MSDKGDTVTDFTNPAKRVLAIVHEAANKPDSESAAAIWAQVFGLDPHKANDDPHSVYMRLNMLRQEIDLVESMMKGTSFSEDLYVPYLDKVRKVVSLTNIAAGWGNYRPQLQPDTFLALRYCSEILPSEEAVSFEELQQILDKIQELKREIEGSSLSKGVHDFLVSQLAIIEKAIVEYPLKGGSAIRNAFREGFADLVSHSENLEKADDKKETEKVAGIWSSLKTAGKEFVEADRLASAYVGLIEKGQSASFAILNLLS